MGLIQDDLPGDQAMAMGDLIVKLSREILEATTGMEEAMMELERRLPKVRTVRVRTVGDPADKKPIKVRVEKIEKNDRT
ncbi:MAG TPA: hypothetical protein ENH32_08255 [Proteobacteria bacterium]|nr:hypothetical protein [Pseudomonadota bacterium]